MPKSSIATRMPRSRSCPRMSRTPIASSISDDSVSSSVSSRGSRPDAASAACDEVDQEAPRELATRDIDGDTDVAPGPLLVPRRGVCTRAPQDPGADVGDQPRLLGERDEVAGEHQPEARTRPADERLEVHDLAVRGVDDRLVVHAELFVRRPRCAAPDRGRRGRRPTVASPRRTARSSRDRWPWRDTARCRPSGASSRRSRCRRRTSRSRCWRRCAPRHRHRRRALRARR